MTHFKKAALINYYIYGADNYYQCDNYDDVSEIWYVFC